MRERTRIIIEDSIEEAPRRIAVQHQNDWSRALVRPMQARAVDCSVMALERIGTRRQSQSALGLAQRLVAHVVPIDLQHDLLTQALDFESERPHRQARRLHGEGESYPT